MLKLVQRTSRIPRRRFISSKVVTGVPQLELLVTGDQPKILFCHGANCQASVWKPLMQTLHQKHGIETAAVSLRGHGKSEGFSDLQSYRITDYVADVKRTISQLPQPVTLVGHSMGGLISQVVAQDTALHCLILVGASPIGGMEKDGFRMMRKHPWTFAKTIFKKSFLNLYQDPAVTHSLLFSPSTPRSVVVEAMAGLQEESYEGASQMNTLLPRAELVKCPVIVLGGQDDFMVSPESVTKTASAYNTTPVMYPKCGHMIQIEVPIETLAEDFKKFIENPPSHGVCA